MTNAEMQRRKSAHRKSDDVRFRLTDVIEHRENVVGCARLRIGRDALRHVRWRKATGVIGDGAVALSEVPHLRLIAAQVAGELVDEDHGMTRSRLLEMQADAVVRG